MKAVLTQKEIDQYLQELARHLGKKKLNENQLISIYSAYRMSRITDLDKEYLKLIAKGMTVIEISAKRNISPRGVEHAFIRCKSKLKARNITSLVAIAIRLKLIQIKVSGKNNPEIKNGLYIKYMQMLAEGMTFAEVASQQHKHPRTVEKTIQLIKQKLNARNLPNLIAIAITRGII